MEKVTFFRVQHYVPEAMEWALTGWFPVPTEVEESIYEEALAFAPEALRMTEEYLGDDVAFATERDIALVAVALAVEKVVDMYVLDWFAEDVLHILARAIRARKALVQAYAQAQA